MTIEGALVHLVVLQVAPSGSGFNGLVLPTRTITVDGNSTDWGNQTEAQLGTDPAGDAGAGLDIQTVLMAKDGTGSLFLAVRLDAALAVGATIQTSFSSDPVGTNTNIAVTQTGTVTANVQPGNTTPCSGGSLAANVGGTFVEVRISESCLSSSLYPNRRTGNAQRVATSTGATADEITGTTSQTIQW